MYGNDPEGEFLLRAWQIITEIGDQLSHNHKFANNLLVQSNLLKAEANDVKTGFSLHRFIVDISKETFESELERANAQIILENHSLTQENKQLSVLLKEYEQTVESIMSKFRSHAVAAQQHELTLTRHYDALLAPVSPPPPPAQVHAHALHRLAQGLSAASMALAGADPAARGPQHDDAGVREIDAELERMRRRLHSRAGGSNPSLNPNPAPTPPPSDSRAASPSASSSSSSSSSSSHSAGAGDTDELDWAHARDIEIARLEAENARLRAVLGISPEALAAVGIADVDAAPEPEPRNTPLFVSAAWKPPPLPPPPPQGALGRAMELSGPGMGGGGGGGMITIGGMGGGVGAGRGRGMLFGGRGRSVGW